MQSLFIIYTYNIYDKVAQLSLKVKAGNKIEKFTVIDDKQYLKLRISAPPEQGKANNAIIEIYQKCGKLKKLI